MDKEIIIKRLSIIKLLYRQGIQQSYLPDTISFFSILAFHDSVEMFLRLAAEKKEVNPDDFKFLQYWERIQDLTLKEAMRGLNMRRVNLKHKGFIPASVEVEASRIATTEFFNENCIKQFGIEFNDISLIELVEDKKTRDYLTDAVKQLELGDMPKCIECVTECFYELIDTYKESKGNFYNKTPLDFIEKTEYRLSYGANRTDIDKRLEDIFKKVTKNFKNIEDTLTITALGLDFKKYMKFKTLTPEGFKTSDDKYFFHKPTDKNWTKENCEFCIDFVIECGLRLQEFDFDYDSLVSMR